MFTEQSLRDYPSVVKAFMGLSAEQFWELVQQMHVRFATYTTQQRQRADRQRAVGAGHPAELAVPLRPAVWRRPAGVRRNGSGRWWRPCHSIRPSRDFSGWCAISQVSPSP